MKNKYSLYSSVLLLVLTFFSFTEIHAEKIKSTISTRRVKLVRHITGKDAGSPRDISNPYCLKVDRERNILLATLTGKGPIVRFDINNNYKFMDFIGESKKTPTKYILEIGIDVNGNIYVLDARLAVVYVFDTEGTFKQTIKPRDIRPGGVGLAFVGIAFSSKGDMYLADKPAKAIQVLDWEGNYLYQIKKARIKKTQFGFPSLAGIKVNSKDEIYLFDNLLSKIIKFNLKGKTLSVFGGRGDVAGKFVNAVNIAIDNKDRIYVVESLTGTIQVFDRDGNFLHILSNDKNERLGLSGPSFLDLDNNNNLYLIERMKNRIVVLKFLD